MSGVELRFLATGDAFGSGGRGAMGTRWTEIDGQHAEPGKEIDNAELPAALSAALPRASPAAKGPSERTVISLADVDPATLGALDREFADLATACLQQPRTLVHRDFQGGGQGVDLGEHGAGFG